MTEKFTERDTKKVILAGYEKAVAELKALKAGKFDPAADAKQKAVATTVANADATATGTNVEETILSLKKQLGTVLDGVSTDIANQVKAYADVQEAIKIKEAELKELFAIEKEANAVVALINAKEAIAKDYDAEHAERVASAKAELEKVKGNIDETRLNFMEEITELKTVEQKRREREQEQYDYDFAKKKRDREDALAAEIKTKKAEFEEKVVAINKDMAERQEELTKYAQTINEREKAVEAQEESIASLEEKHAEAVKEAVNKAQREASSRFYAEKSILEKEMTHQKELAEAKIASIEATNAKLVEENAKLAEKLEKAYQQVQDIASKTIDNSGDKKVINQLERLVQNQKSTN